MTRFIFVVGGVMSGVGKGIATASIGRILKSKGFKIASIKIDPYINVDAGTMNPVEHGEVFVTDDGTECDQDVGNYERFLEENFYTDNYMTTGRVYQAVINRERSLGYHGKCVEVVPHIPEEVISRIKKVAKNAKADFVTIEIGGTVGEYQNLLFLEAARMLKIKEPKNVIFVMVSYLPVPGNLGEMKTKPTQNAVRLLNSAGIQPNIILCRAQVPIDDSRRRKISIFCNIDEKDAVSAPDVHSVYEVPLNFEKENLGNRVLKEFGMKPRPSKMENWKKLVESIETSEKPVRIGIVGKYFETGKFVLTDSYISVLEAIKHASWFLKRKPEIVWFSSEEYEKNPENLKELKDLDGIIVPGGFGNRGVEGKIKAIEYARKNKIPFLGLCLGMQLAVVEYSRHVLGIKDANSREMDPQGKNCVIDFMNDQKGIVKNKNYGGTMRLGAYPCRVLPGTTSAKAYRQEEISERHRHRYELNNDYRQKLEERGMIMAGINPDRDLVEIIELPDHPFFIGVQFHPELKSRPLTPHPLFMEFVKAAAKIK